MPSKPHEGGGSVHPLVAGLVARQDTPDGIRSGAGGRATVAAQPLDCDTEPFYSTLSTHSSQPLNPS